MNDWSELEVLIARVDVMNHRINNIIKRVIELEKKSKGDVIG